jgi:predicted  nucleic acid-binding Zn-ribbon protein
MSEEETKTLVDSGVFQNRLFDELAVIRDNTAGMNTRLTVLEDRLFSELGAIRSEIAGLDARLTAVEKRLVALENRLSALEDRVEARLLETRPIWEAVQSSIKRLATSSTP